ncbi:hypothetical protein ACQUW5_13220 [Legionella sp. CNM-1927-20]|uniref:hypothetical protein n=1 Tax=Legionella sp. CNM-1927-20 TaxID=3422221 RepID=UPI00403B2CFF
MLLEKRFERFQQRYKQIINIKGNHSTAYEKLKAFIFSNITYPPEDIEDFEFYLDKQRKKLVFSVTGGLYNGNASEILHFFRHYDDQAEWYLFSDRIKTVRKFELNLEKLDNNFLNDFEAFVVNPQLNRSLAQLPSEMQSKDYISPINYRKYTDVSKKPSMITENLPIASQSSPIVPQNNKLNTCCNTRTLAKFAGLFAIGAAILISNQLIQNPENEQKNILN